MEIERRCLAESGNSDFQTQAQHFYQSALQYEEAEQRLLRLKEFSPAVIVFSEASPFSGRAAPIHKCILGFVTAHHWIELVRSKVREVTFSGAQSQAPHYKVKGSDRKIVHSAQFDRVLERIGPKPGYCGITESLFAGALTQFAIQNSSGLSINNGGDPYDGTTTVFHNVPRLRTERISDATNDLLSYLERDLRFVLEDGSVKVNSERTIIVDSSYRYEPYFRRKPELWFGMKVAYEDMRPVNEEVKQRSVVASPTTFSLDEPLRPIIGPGQAIQSTSDLASQIRGVLSYFVKRIGSSKKPYLLAPKHSVGDKRGDKIVAVGRDSSGEKVTKEIAVIGGTPFEETIIEEREHDKYSCLNDIVIASATADLDEISNVIDDSRLKSPCSVAEYFFSSSGRAFIRGVEIGRISSVFNHRRFDYDEGGRFSFLSEVFSVTCDGKKADAVISGALVESDEECLLGIVVGRKDDQIYCVEAAKVHEKLGIELL